MSSLCWRLILLWICASTTAASLPVTDLVTSSNPLSEVHIAGSSSSAGSPLTSGVTQRPELARLSTELQTSLLHRGFKATPAEALSLAHELAATLHRHAAIHSVGADPTTAVAESLIHGFSLGFQRHLEQQNSPDTSRVVDTAGEAHPDDLSLDESSSEKLASENQTEPDPPADHHDAEDFLKIDDLRVNVGMVIFCTCCAALAAGLTMGLVSIEPLAMAIKMRSGSEAEKKQAGKLLPIVSRHHFLLVTLLLFNSLANEALPIFLDNLVPAYLAVIMSVSLILIFGEIIPSAIFTGPSQMKIASALSPVVWFLMVVLSPIAWPLAWLLDRVLGIEGLKRYTRSEIAALVDVQHELARRDSHDLAEDPLHKDEVAIVNGVLQTSEKCVADAMVPIDKVYCLGMDEELGPDVMADILAAGYSRVLVYDGHTRNIRGYLQIKRLIVLNPDDKRKIRSLVLRVPEVVSPQSSLLELLNTFQMGKTHLALVSNSPKLTTEAIKHGVCLEGAAQPIGIITLEDIFEEIIQEEIYDETDLLNQLIESRARDVILKYTRQRRDRKPLGRYAGLARPSLKASIHDHLPGRDGDSLTPKSPTRDRLRATSKERGRSRGRTTSYKPSSVQKLFERVVQAANASPDGGTVNGGGVRDPHVDEGISIMEEGDSKEGDRTRQPLLKDADKGRRGYT